MALEGNTPVVTARLPRAAREVMERGTLCYLAVLTPQGPHLTPVVYVLDGGRLWLTTSRTSVKARALRQDRNTAAMIRSGDQAVTVRGTARTYDALDPLSWPFAAVAGPRLVRAATRFSLKNARFFAGYAADARQVPLAWTPPGRIFVGIDITAGAILGLAGGRVSDRWGESSGGAWRLGGRGATAKHPPGRALDLRVPRSVRSVVGDRGDGALALGATPTVLPVTWRRVARERAYHAVLPGSFLELAEPPIRQKASRHPSAALVVDHLAAWRAAEMTGMLIQGQPDPSPDDGEALVRLRPQRVVWWQGWSSGSVSE